MRRLTSVAVACALLVGALSAFAPSAAAVDPALTSFSLSGTPFAADFAPLPTRATLTAVLSRRSTVTVTVRRPNGNVVRRLAVRRLKNAGTRMWTWNGRDDSGALVGDGPYVARIVATTSTGTERIDRPVRKGLPAIYPANAGAIVVVVDPGHGGRFWGAVNGPYQEKDYNLAIGLKLRDLLETAGVTVVTTRTADVAVNEPASDLNGDGVLDRYDDDLQRNDIANGAHADLAVHVHNNAASNVNAHGTETYTDGNRTWTAQGVKVAEDVLNGVAGTLASYESATFHPVNAGVHKGWYYYMGPYNPPFLIRAALMTSVLSESLFITNASELAALQRPDIQLAIASGIYLGVAQYLNSRAFGVAYELVSGPSSAVAGSTLSYQVRVTNRGTATSDGWTLGLATVPAVPLYDGSGEHGAEIGSATIPDGLAPGQSAVVTVPATAPAVADVWLVKSDVLVAGGASLADAGIVPLQVALTTSIAP